MVAAFDFTKIRKDRNKRLNMRAGFDDPITWLDTGNYALNKMISGQFKLGVPLGAVTVFAGEFGCLPAKALVRIRIEMEFETRTVTVGEFRDLWHRDDLDIEIDTPDGFQRITAWFDKGPYSILRIEATNGLATRCASCHLLQRSNGTWALASELTVGDEILTENGLSRVSCMSETGVEECFDFEVDHPNHRYWGDGFSSHNSGKSYIVSGNIVRDALAQGCHVILLDSEDALKATWMRNLGVDPDHPRLTKEIASTVNHIAQCVRDYTESYVKLFQDTPREEQPKLLFVVDSLGMVETDNDI